MGRIYEALEKADHGFKIKDMPTAEYSVNKRWPAVPQIETEDKMIRFYQHLEILIPDTGMKVIQFVGSRNGEGASSIVNQFAKALVSKMHKSVLILDADRANPTQHIYFGVNPEYCLNEVISGRGPIEKAFCEMACPGLSLCLVSGNSVSPAQVLNGNRLWEIFRNRFDLVLIDSPPLDKSSDALGLVGKADGIVLVIEAENTRWPVVKKLRDSVNEHGGNILGAVFNKQRFYIPEWIYKRL